MLSSAYVWAKIINTLEEQYDPITISTWFDDAEVEELTEERLVLHTGDEYRQSVIDRRFKLQIQDILRELTKTEAKVYIYNDHEIEVFRNKSGKSSGAVYNPLYTFENFVVGPSNRFAYSAALAAAQTPGKVYNPLFIYGPPGIGKTHLLYAIANGIRKDNPEANVIYINGEQFPTELIDAIKSGKNIEFRNKYREADLFLIDDIQFIAGKDATQEEFFHTFNKLYEGNKQIVMTSDRKPSDMLTLEDRLKTRFEWGLLADIQPPDYETRVAIVKDKANHVGLQLPDDVCDYIAKNVTSSVRQIEGTVNKIRAYRDMNNMPLDLPNVSRAISDMFQHGGSSLPTPNLIINQVCKFYSVDESVLRGNLKNKGTAEARQVAVYLIRKLTNLSTTEIGKEVDKDHSTVIYSIRKVESALKNGDKNLQDHIRDITANINSCL